MSANANPAPKPGPLRWIAACLCMLVASPVIFTVAMAIYADAMALTGHANNVPGEWRSLSQFAIEDPLRMIAFVGIVATIPALAIAIPAAILLERRRCSLLVYIIAGGVLGFLGGLALTKQTEPSLLNIALMASLYGAIAASVFHIALHGLARTIARATRDPHDT